MYFKLLDIKHQLWETTTGYLYVSVIVKKTEKERVSHMELLNKKRKKKIEEKRFIFALCFNSTSCEKPCLLSVSGFETQY